MTPEQQKLNIKLCEKLGHAQKYRVVKGFFYYRPMACGYTDVPSEAGLWSKENATALLVKGEEMHIELAELPNLFTSQYFLAIVKALRKEGWHWTVGNYRINYTCQFFESKTGNYFCSEDADLPTAVCLAAAKVWNLE